MYKKIGYTALKRWQLLMMCHFLSITFTTPRLYNNVRLYSFSWLTTVWCIVLCGVFGIILTSSSCRATKCFLMEAAHRVGAFSTLIWNGCLAASRVHSRNFKIPLNTVAERLLLFILRIFCFYIYLPLYLCNVYKMCLKTWGYMTVCIRIHIYIIYTKILICSFLRTPKIN